MWMTGSVVGWQGAAEGSCVGSPLQAFLMGAKAASNLLPPSAREDTRSLLAMEADQTMVQIFIALLLQSGAGLSDMDPKYP